MINLGLVKPGTTIYVPFDTFDGGTGASITMTGIAVGDIKIYKDGGMTERASTSGFTLLDTDGIDIDGITGIQGFYVDLSDNTTANFYEAGSKFFIVVDNVTIDGQTVSFLAAMFEIGYEGAILNTTIASLSSQTSFTLEDGSADDDAYNACICVVHDLASAIQIAQGFILNYTGASKTITLGADPGIFTMAVGDHISIFPRTALTGDTYARLGAPTGATISDDLITIDTVVDNILTDTDALDTRLTTTRAGYLDELDFDLNARLGSPVGASISDDLVTIDSVVDAIVAVTANLPDSGALTTIDGNIDTLIARLTAARAGYLDELDFDLDARLGTPSVSIAADIAALNDLSAAEVNAEVDTALSDIHLDHLFATAYDATSKPGAADALLNEMVEDDAGVTRYTQNALEQGPGGGDATAANQTTIIGYVDELETRLTSARAGYLDELGAANIPADIDTLLGRLTAARAGYLDELDFDLDARLGTPSTSIAGDIAALNDLSAADVNAEVDTALSDIHLDHLLAVDYDPAAPPGVATALLNELIESDGGVSRFTANALEQAPDTGDATAANQTTIIGYVDELETRLTSARAGYLDELDFDLDARLGTPAGASISADLLTIDNLVDDLESRLTAARAGYLDELDFDLDARLGTPAGASISADLVTIDGVVDAIETDTQDIQGRLPAALVSGRMDSNMAAISDDATAADRLEAMMDGVILAQVNDSSATTTDFAADQFTEATDDHFNGRLITFITGALTGQQTDITDYDAAGGAQGSQQFTVTALTEAPANDVWFVIH